MLITCIKYKQSADNLIKMEIGANIPLKVCKIEKNLMNENIKKKE